MKNLLLTALLAGLAHTAHAQGRIDFTNNGNSDPSPFATSKGLFWLSTGGTPALINQDFNAAFYGGTDSSSLSLLATFLLSDGTATHDNGSGPGTFTDPLGKTYAVPGAGESAFFQIQAWTGTFNSYTAAVAGGSPASQSPIFVNPVSIPPGAPPLLTDMPAMVLAVPEPSAFTLGVAGGLLLLLFRRRPTDTAHTYRQ